MTDLVKDLVQKNKVFSDSGLPTGHHELLGAVHKIMKEGDEHFHKATGFHHGDHVLHKSSGNRGFVDIIKSDVDHHGNVSKVAIKHDDGSYSHHPHTELHLHPSEKHMSARDFSQDDIVDPVGKMDYDELQQDEQHFSKSGDKRIIHTMGTIGGVTVRALRDRRSLPNSMNPTQHWGHPSDIVKHVTDTQKRMKEVFTAHQPKTDKITKTIGLTDLEKTALHEHMHPDAKHFTGEEWKAHVTKSKK